MFPIPILKYLFVPAESSGSCPGSGAEVDEGTFSGGPEHGQDRLGDQTQAGKSLVHERGEGKGLKRAVKHHKRAVLFRNRYRLHLGKIIEILGQVVDNDPDLQLGLELLDLVLQTMAVFSAQNEPGLDAKGCF